MSSGATFLGFQLGNITCGRYNFESKKGPPSTEATLSLNGLWSVLKRIGVTLTPIEKEEVKVKLFMDCGNTLNLAAFMKVVSWLAAAKQSAADLTMKA